MKRNQSENEIKKEKGRESYQNKENENEKKIIYILRDR